MAEYTLKPITEDEARQLVAWRYEPPYDIYNLDAAHTEDAVRYYLDPQYQIYGITDQDGIFIGFCSFGEDARVGGGDYSEALLDLGIGLNPSYTSRGLGPAIIQTMMSFAHQQFGATGFRAAIDESNLRSQRAFAKVGFVPTQRFNASHNQTPYVMMVLRSQKQNNPSNA